MAEYEEQRLRRIEENKRKMEELNLKPLAYEAMGSMKGKKQKINKTMKSKEVFANDDEYIPDEEVDHQDDDIEGVQTTTSLRFCSKKVMASPRGNHEKSMVKPKFSTASMASLVKTRSQTHQKNWQQSKYEKQQDVNSLQMKQPERLLPPLGQKVHTERNGGVSSQVILQHKVSMGSERNLPMRSQQAVQNNTNAKKGHGMTVVAPGTLGLFVRMKEKSKEEQISKQIDALDQLIESSQKQQSSYSGMQLFENDTGCRFDLVDEDEGSQSLDDYVVEEEQNIDPVPQKTNEPIAHDQTTNNLVLQKEKRTRGPTMSKDVHGWTINERRPIILNEKGQPIGPDNVTLRKFSSCYGSLARDSTLAPLNWHDWRYVPDKEKIWDYVKKKFIISEEGKNYVLSSVGALWRSYKSRLKKKHYFKYDNENARWNNRPKEVPEAHFKDLLKYWDLEEVQEISQKNKEHNEGQKDRHTMGPISFARKRHELEQAENKPPSKATMYMETRKRTDGRKYKTSYIEKVPESGKSRLLGRGTKREKQPSKSGVLIPDEVLQPYKAQIVKETFGEVMKFLKDQIPSETLAYIASSLNEHSFGGINDKEQCKDDTGGHDGANNDDDDIEGNMEKNENEDEDHEEN